MATTPRFGLARKARSGHGECSCGDTRASRAAYPRVIYREGSGCYGRLSTDDAPLDAALMSRAVGKPVRVQWMRNDEHGWEPKGLAQLLTVRAGLDSQGKIVAWDYMDRSLPWTASPGTPLLASRQIGLKPHGDGFPNGSGGGGDVYEFDNQKIVAAAVPWVHQDPTPLRTSNLRAPGELARTFATESFMEEIAAITGTDPVQFRLHYLRNNKRATDALLAATRKARWQERPSPASPTPEATALGRGVALGSHSNTITSVVAEVEINKSSGKVLVKRVTISHDCGLIVNPDGLTNQIEGNVIQGVSRTLLEKVQFDSLGVKSLDWASYPIIKFEDVPDVNVILIDRPEMPALDGRTLYRCRSRGDRQRHFRRRGSASTRHSSYARKYTERPPGLKHFCLLKGVR